MTEHRSARVRRGQILQAARKCFIRDGYFKTKVVDIASAVGLSKGGIYFHFSSKRHIFQTLVELEFEEATRLLDKMADSKEGLHGKLVQLSNYCMQMFSDPEQARFMVTVGEMALRDKETSELLKRLYREHNRRIKDLLDLAQQNGEIEPVDSAAMAVALRSLFDGIQLSCVMGFDDVSQDEVIAAAISFVSKGLTKKED